MERFAQIVLGLLCIILIHVGVGLATRRIKRSFKNAASRRSAKELRPAQDKMNSTGRIQEHRRADGFPPLENPHLG